MTLARWTSERISPDTRLGEGVRRAYRRITPRVARAWTEVLHGLAAGKPQVRFVQVGSNDAAYGDPLRYHILNNGWRGVMIEPLPHIFARLQARYGEVSGLQFANVAIDSEPGERSFYHLRESDEPDLPPWYDLLGSFSYDNVLKHQEFLSDIPERIVSTTVRCATFEQVCAEHGIDGFDVLNIDAEGYDYEVLKSVALARHRPTVVLYENTHLSRADYEASLADLHAADMLTNSDVMDTVAVSREALRAHKPLARGWRFLRKRTGASVDARHAEYPVRSDRA